MLATSVEHASRAFEPIAHRSDSEEFKEKILAENCRNRKAWMPKLPKPRQFRKPLVPSDPEETVVATAKGTHGDSDAGSSSDETEDVPILLNDDHDELSEHGVPEHDVDDLEEPKEKENTAPEKDLTKSHEELEEETKELKPKNQLKQLQNVTKNSTPGGLSKEARSRQRDE